MKVSIFAVLFKKRVESSFKKTIQMQRSKALQAIK